MVNTKVFVGMRYCRNLDYTCTILKACSCAAALPTYVHDALGYSHYAMQFPRKFGLTCFKGTITLWIIDACMPLIGMLNQL